jgi:nitrogen-specific signal transduction histidine kinase
VIDDGPGVPSEIAGRLFAPYPHSGTRTSYPDSVGLGLSIVKRLAGAMGGSISYSRIDSMTVFELILDATSDLSPALILSTSVPEVMR